MRCGVQSRVYACSNAGTTSCTKVLLNTVNVTSTGSRCAPGELVVLTYGEFESAAASPFHLTLAQGGAISASILLVWAAGWGVRQLVRVLRTPEPETSFHD